MEPPNIQSVLDPVQQEHFITNALFTKGCQEQLQLNNKAHETCILSFLPISIINDSKF